jgi:pantoate--beta-alanine ligase
MRVLAQHGTLKQAVAETRAGGGKVGLIPTMGYLHEGHLALVRRARSENDLVVMSNFVNPLQFGPAEDYATYPRDLERDTYLAGQAGVDIMFHPEAATMYPPVFRTSVEVEGLGDRLCGRHRPGHFRGVATVVLKLFNLVGPDRAYFGLKDYQQVVIIARMVQDLNLPVQVVACATVRDHTGLALSSRNRNLSPRGRQAASVLQRTLRAGAEALAAGERRAGQVREVMRRELAREPLASVEYISVSSAVTLEELQGIASDTTILLALAARIEGTRLIDNLLVDAAGRETGPPPAIGVISG